jgi:hypothetical protein
MGRALVCSSERSATLLAGTFAAMDRFDCRVSAITETGETGERL